MSKIKSLIKILGHCYNKQLEPETVSVYAASLEESYTAEIIQEACSRIKKAEKFFPSLQTVVEYCGLVKGSTANRFNVKNKNCTKCSNTGRVHVKDTRSQEGISYTYAFRCDCSIGEQFQSFKPIADYNGYI